MSSINDRRMVDQIIVQKGRYHGVHGRLTFKLIYKRDDRDYILNNMAGHNIKSIWRLDA